MAENGKKRQKYMILQGDGMADYPIDELGGRTPLAVAKTPHMDVLAQRGTLGLVKTIPDGYPPGSAVGNMSILGYDPRKYYTGRAPLEAAAMGVELEQSDIAFRCNLVTLGKEDDTKVMKDYSAGHIPTEDAQQLIKMIQDELGTDEFQFYPGPSYRHLMVWRGGIIAGGRGLELTPPHDIFGQRIEGYLPKEEKARVLVRLIEKSQEILKNNQINKDANSIWLWGQGTRPSIPTLQESRGLNGAIISAVNLIKGLGIYIGLDVIEVPGATGFIDTNYLGKARAALKSLRDRDLVFVHVEAPDEAGHQGNLAAKIKAIEDFDTKIVGVIVDRLKKIGDFSLLVLTDHYTPIMMRTHVGNPVPFVIFRSNDITNGKVDKVFNEESAKGSKIIVKDGYEIMDILLKGGPDTVLGSSHFSVGSVA